MSKSELKRLCTLNPMEMADRLHKLETQLVTIQDMFSDALQSDLEHGVKCLNENASIEFHEKYPELALALRRLSDIK